MKIEGNTDGKIVSHLNIISQHNQYGAIVHGPFGKCVGDRDFELVGHVIEFYGRAGNLLDNIGVYSLPITHRSQFFGYQGCTLYFTEGPDAHFPPVIKISRIALWYLRNTDRVSAAWWCD